MRREPRARLPACVRLCQLLAAPGGGEPGFQNSPIRGLRTADTRRRLRAAAFSQRTMVAARSLDARWIGDGSQLLLGELAKRVGNGASDAQRHRAVSNRIPSEAIAD